MYTFWEKIAGGGIIGVYDRIFAMDTGVTPFAKDDR
jgi:hypothetical protein